MNKNGIMKYCPPERSGGQIGINTDDIDPKMDVHMGVHSATLEMRGDQGAIVLTLPESGQRIQVGTPVQALGIQHAGVEPKHLAAFDHETDQLNNRSIEKRLSSNSMPMSTAIQLIQQGALGRAFEETADRERRAKGVKKVAGPKGLITWPTVVVRPGKPRGLRRR